jgi:hypothetical protein
MGFLADLPFELLRFIVIELNYDSLKSFSVVNKSCRSVSTLDIFSTFKVEFSEQGMKKFERLAISSLAQCVRVLHYDALELVDSCMWFSSSSFDSLLIFLVIQHWDYLSTYIYTPQEYARDQKNFREELRGKQFSYKAIFSYFKRLARA